MRKYLPGFLPNPLKNGKIRNMKCICKSGKKIKHCHGLGPAIESKFKPMLDEALKVLLTGKQCYLQFRDDKDADKNGP